MGRRDRRQQSHDLVSALEATRCYLILVLGMDLYKTIICSVMGAIFFGRLVPIIGLEVCPVS